MRFKSTRDAEQRAIGFEDMVMLGLSPDGGLYVPETFPKLDHDKIMEWKDLSFAELALQLFSLFIDQNEIPNSDLKHLVEKSWKEFDTKDVVVTKNIYDDFWLLELWHGPTLAFKDVALQFLGNLFEYFLSRKRITKPSDSRPFVVLGATSGDTGSAAIAALRGKFGLDIVICHPFEKVSPIQELQMTTVMDSNVHNLALKGHFDDCQSAVKEIFTDPAITAKFHFGAVNSINFARIMAQMTYYFYSYYRVRANSSEIVHFVVPTGNFGDILAGYYAKKIGLPIGKLAIATNENDLLHRFCCTGEYKLEQVKETCAPSMDIQISSNFERYLYDIVDGDANQIVKWMADLKNRRSFKVSDSCLTRAKEDFFSAAVNQDLIVNCIREFARAYSILLDPHTAVGIAAAEKLKSQLAGNIICLSTAHPAKFPEIVKQAAKGSPVLGALDNEKLMRLYDRPKRMISMPATSQAVIEYLEKAIKTP